MTVNQLSLDEVANYLRIDSDYDANQLQMCLDSAKRYVSNYTGLPLVSENEDDITCDTYEDIAIAVLVLCQDMWDNRAMVTDKGQNVNKVVQSILDMHSVNLL